MKHVTLVIGHTELRQGAKNPLTGLTEFRFNSMLAMLINSKFDVRAKARGLEVKLTTVSHKYVELPSKLNKLDLDLIVAMHCNAFNTKVRGQECLYYSESRAGAVLSRTFLNAFKCFLSPYRGTKALEKGHRGFKLVKNTKAVCLIMEPFFIDNNTDTELALRSLDTLANCYITGILDCLERKL